MWLALIGGWVEGGEGGPALRAALGRATRHASRRLPDAWFELGSRTPEALDGLTNRLFTTCDRVEKGRFPFRGRRPFRAFVDDAMPDAAVNLHLFYARLSILRELMRDDYARNIRRDPELRRRDRTYRELGELLPQVARADGDRWDLPAPLLRRALPPEEVVRVLRTEPQRALGPLALRALELLGRPARQSELAHLLADVDVDDAATQVHEPGSDDPDARAVRDAVLAAWNELDATSRALLAALIRDEDYDAISERVPGLATRPQVSRAMRRIADTFVRRVASALDQAAEHHSTPRALLEHVLDVLLPMLPADGGPDERA